MSRYLPEMMSFAAVVEAGGFIAAARDLGLSKGLISQHVKRLETVLGAQLLFRSTRRVELTESGALFLVHCRDIRQRIDGAFEAMNALRAVPEGTIRMTVPVSFGEFFLNQIIANFQILHPAITVDLELENQYRDMKATRMDIAIRSGLTDDPDQVALPLGEYSELVCAAPDYWHRNPPPQTPADLTGHECLVNFHLVKDGRWIFFSPDGPESIPVSGRLRLNHYPLIRDAACAGAGVARLPRYVVAAEVAAGRLELALSGYDSPRSPIYLVYPYQGSLPLKNRLLIDFIRHWFRERPGLLQG